MPKLSEVMAQQGAPRRMKLSELSAQPEAPPQEQALSMAAPAPEATAAPRPTGLLGLFAGPAPIQGGTLEERQADYQSRPAAVRALAGVGQFVDRNVRGLNQLAGTVNPAMDERSRVTDAAMEGDALTAGASIGAETLALLAPAGAISRIPTFTGRLAAGGALGAASGGLQAEDAPGQRTTNMVAGAAFGAGGELGGQALRALGAKLSPEVMAIYNSAKKFGIELTPAQLSNSQFLKRAENMLRSLPLNGAAKQWERQVEQFNRALAKQFGEDAPRITPEVFAAAKSRIGAHFDELSAKSTLRVSDQLMERIGALQQEARAFGDDGTIRAVDSMVDRLLKQAKDGQLPGPAYKSLDSQLGKLMSTGGEKSYFLGQFRDAVREAMDESIGPEAKAAWQQARQQYRNLKTVESLVASSPDGALSPVRLMGRVTADRSGKASMAAGTRGEMGELARVGQAMKAPPSSNTPENLWAQHMFNPFAWPVLAAGSIVGLAGRAANGSPLTQIMASQKVRPAVANHLARIAPPASLAARPVAVPVEEERGRGR